MKAQSNKEFNILHVIDSLSVGGAEVLLKNTVSILPQYKHCIVYLNDKAPLKPAFNNADIDFICLHFKNWPDILRCVLQLKKIIRQVNPDIVHSHLFIATLITRLAVPADVPLVNTLHSIFSIDAFKKNKKSLWVERLTLKKRHVLIGVSKYVLKDYLQWVKFKGKSFVLYNFLPDDSFKKKEIKSSATCLKCLLVGNLKEAKNYFYLLEIAERVKEKNIVLDIYGDGHLMPELQYIIDEKKLNVKLCGQSEDIKKTFAQYDLFIQASEYEGFGLSVIEAMATGLPVFLSDIQVFREITGGNAHFFPLNDSKSAADKLIALYNDGVLRNEKVEKAFCYVRSNYSQKIYLKKLLTIYSGIAKVKNNLNY